MKWIFLTYFLCIHLSITFSQEFKLQNIGFDWGLIFLDNKIYDPGHIRGDVSASDEDHASTSILSFSFRYSTGIKTEFYFLNNMFGFSPGIRYSRTYDIAGKWGLFTEGQNFFYWLYREEGVNTEYMRVKRIYQRSDYLGIPVEIRFFPARRPHRMQFYLKLGAEVDFRLQTQTNIVFRDERMHSYEEEVASQVGKPGHVGFSMYQCFGFRIGSDANSTFSIEAVLPGFNLTSRTSGLLKTFYGGGIQFHLQIPIQSGMQ